MDGDPYFQGTISIACCCICGAAIHNKDERPKWTTQFHTVYATETAVDARAYLSTSGRREKVVDIIDVDPSDIASHGKETLRINLMPYSFHDSSLAPFVSDVSPEVWGYPFHSACWKVLTAFRPIAQEDLQSLLNLGRSMPKQKGMLNWGHDYGGRAKHRRGMSPSHDSMLLVPAPVIGFDIDPGNIDELHQIFQGHKVVSSQHREQNATKRGRVNASDPFSKLPEDILFSIVDHLTLGEVSLLKQASREFANLELPGSFWRKMFQLGQRFDYIIEAREYSQVNWRLACKAIKTAIDNGTSEAYAVWLRRRSWDMCHLLHQALETMRDSSACLGSTIKSHFEPHEPETLKSWDTVGPACKLMGDILDRGCRVIYERMLELPTVVREIHVSTVELFGRRYISGLMLVDESNEVRSIGFQHPASKEILMGRQEIWGLMVAIDQRGVRGLSLMYGINSVSQWIGDHENLSKQELEFGSFRNFVPQLKGGFDAVKLVELSFGTPARPLLDIQAWLGREG